MTESLLNVPEKKRASTSKQGQGHTSASCSREKSKKENKQQEVANLLEGLRTEGGDGYTEDMHLPGLEVEVRGAGVAELAAGMDRLL